MLSMDTLVVNFGWTCFLVPYALGILPQKYSVSTFRQMGTSIAFEDIAHSEAHHKKVPNKAHNYLHLVSNPFSALSLLAILDTTDEIFATPFPFQHVEINGAGLYFLTLLVVYFIYDPYMIRRVVTSIYLTMLFALREPFETFVVTHFGKNALVVYFWIYVFSQGIPIASHYIVEGYYVHNWTSVLVYQQYMSIWGICHHFNFYGSGEMRILVESRVDYYVEHPHVQPRVLKNVDSLLLKLMKHIHWFGRTFLPHYSTLDVNTPLRICGLLQLILHRAILEKCNLKKSPQTPGDMRKSMRQTNKCPVAAPKFRPDDGYGTDVDNPFTGITGYAIGRNMPAIPKHLRDQRGGPDVQMVAQRLLAREGFTPAGDQLNIIAAAWIQAQVHGWMGHIDGDFTEMRNGEGLCPLKQFKFPETLERFDGHYDSERSQWWDASFLYGQNSQQLSETRSFVGGKLKVNTVNPDILAMREDGTYFIGDQKNSWIGISILQDLFLKEHNYICDQLAERYPSLNDDELFGYARNIIAALNAKIHTVDWTVELLKTDLLDVGMNTNWYGLVKAFKGKHANGPNLFAKVGKKKANNKGIPFCLTEEFAAVYRLHPLCPPGVVLHNEDTSKEFIPFEDLLNEDGRQTLQRSKDTPRMISKSMFEYPCGHLIGSNYPDALRKVGPSDEDGCDQGFKVDMAAIDLFRDRERGIQKYNEFRRQLHLPPFKSWLEMTGDLNSAKKLEVIYGPAPEGIEKCDLLVGDLYEKKLPGFAISETSFIVFVMVGLEADPFLHEYFDKEHYTEFGLQYIFDNDGLIELLNRHYPDIAKPFVDRGQSAFKPIHGPEKWQESIEDGTVDPSLLQMWKDVKEDNEEFFGSMMRGEVEEEEGTRHVSFLDEESDNDIANETTKLLA